MNQLNKINMNYQMVKLYNYNNHNYQKLLINYLQVMKILKVYNIC